MSNGEIWITWHEFAVAGHVQVTEKPRSGDRGFSSYERMTGFEPATLTLAR